MKAKMFGQQCLSGYVTWIVKREEIHLFNLYDYEIHKPIICREALGLPTDICIVTVRYHFKWLLIQYLSESARNKIHTPLDGRVVGKGFEEKRILIFVKSKTKICGWWTGSHRTLLFLSTDCARLPKNVLSASCWVGFAFFPLLFSFLQW